MEEILSHYAELLTDPAHTLVEFTFVLIDVVVIGKIGAWWARRKIAAEHKAHNLEEH